MSQNGADGRAKLAADLVEAGAKVAKIMGDCDHGRAVMVCSACVAALMAAGANQRKMAKERIAVLTKGIERPDRPLHRMLPTQIGDHLRQHAHHLVAHLPDGTLFCLVVFAEERDTEDHNTQYISNAERPGIVAALRQLADRLEA